MAVTYKKLFHLMIDKDVTNAELIVPFPKKQTQNEAKKPNGSTSQVTAANRPAKHRGDTQPKAE